MHVFAGEQASMFQFESLEFSSTSGCFNLNQPRPSSIEPKVEFEHLRGSQDEGLKSQRSNRLRAGRLNSGVLHEPPAGSRVRRFETFSGMTACHFVCLEVSSFEARRPSSSKLERSRPPDFGSMTEVRDSGGGVWRSTCLGAEGPTHCAGRKLLTFTTFCPCCSRSLGAQSRFFGGGVGSKMLFRVWRRWLRNATQVLEDPCENFCTHPRNPSNFFALLAISPARLTVSVSPVQSFNLPWKLSESRALHVRYISDWRSFRKCNS